MTDRTDWARLEPRPYSEEMTDGLRAPVRDPLWMLTRQWQFGERQGEDGGSPVEVELDVAEDRVTRVDPRGDDAASRGPVDPFDYDGGPLESIAERESVATDDDPPLRLRAETGQQFLRTLADTGYGEYAAADFPASLRLDTPDEPLESSDRRYVELVSGRTLDGTAVARAIQSAVGNIDAVVADEADSWSRVDASRLPLPTDEFRTDRFDEAIEAFYGWYVDLYDEPTTDTGTAWDPARLAYRFAVSTGAGELETVFEAPEYRGGQIDWYSFSTAGDPAGETVSESEPSLREQTAENRPSSGPAVESLDPSVYGDSDGVAVDIADGEARDTRDDPLTLADLDETGVFGPTIRRSKRLVPATVSFPGMPASRFWEFEESDVDLTRMTADGVGLSRLLLAEFALQYGDEWFQIDLDTPVGTLSRITDLRVTDSFGITERATAAADDDWRLFSHDLPRHEVPGLFLPPTLANSTTGDPVERVVFSRDESANLAFAVERRYEGPTGRAVDRTEFQRPELVIDSVASATDPDEEYVTLANPGEDRLSLDGVTISVDGDDGVTELLTLSGGRLEPGATLRVYTGSPSTDAGDSVGARSDSVGVGRTTSILTNADVVTVTDSEGHTRARQLLDERSETLPDYRLSPDIPDYWFPFTPEQGWSFQLERALLLDADSLGDVDHRLPTPEGKILQPPAELLPRGQETYRVFDEEISRAGREVTRRYRHARWIDGAGYLWSGRESRIGDTQLSSGLQFDTLEQSE